MTLTYTPGEDPSPYVFMLERVVRSRKNASVDIARLAAMRVDESLIFTLWKRTHRLTGHRKRAARALLNDSQADWTSRLTNKGVRVTRVA